MRRTQVTTPPQCAVAVADKVTGPYKFVARMRPNAGFWPQNVPDAEKKPLSPEEEAAFAPMRFNGGPDSMRAGYLILRAQHAGGQMARDMTAFVDDDGKAYLIYASEHNGTLHLSLLDDTYTKHVGKYVRITPLAYNESPTIFKRGGRYFMITSRCNGWNPSDARLLTANSIWGPWESVGNPCVGPEDRTKITFESQSTHVLPVRAKKTPSSSWPTAGVPAMPSTVATSGCPSSSTRPATRSSNGGKNGTWEFFDARSETAAAQFSDNGRTMKLVGPASMGWCPDFPRPWKSQAFARC